MAHPAKDFRITERVYSAWPNSIRAVFEPARTVETGKPAFRFGKTREDRI